MKHISVKEYVLLVIAVFGLTWLSLYPHYRTGGKIHFILSSVELHLASLVWLWAVMRACSLTLAVASAVKLAKGHTNMYMSNVYRTMAIYCSCALLALSLLISSVFKNPYWIDPSSVDGTFHTFCSQVIEAGSFTSILTCIGCAIVFLVYIRKQASENISEHANP